MDAVVLCLLTAIPFLKRIAQRQPLLCALSQRKLYRICVAELVELVLVGALCLCERLVGDSLWGCHSLLPIHAHGNCNGELHCDAHELGEWDGRHLCLAQLLHNRVNDREP